MIKKISEEDGLPLSHNTHLSLLHLYALWRKSQMGPRPVVKFSKQSLL